MSDLQHLFDNNARWAESITQSDPDCFAKLATQQSLEYLWTGCSDVRVPASEIVGLLPGDLFVHRNVANVSHTSIVQNAWHRGQDIAVRGCIYGRKDGRWKSFNGWSNCLRSTGCARWSSPE